MRLIGAFIVIAEGSTAGGALGLAVYNIHLRFISTSGCPVEEIKQWFLKSSPTFLLKSVSSLEDLDTTSSQ